MSLSVLANKRSHEKSFGLGNLQLPSVSNLLYLDGYKDFK